MAKKQSYTAPTKLLPRTFGGEGEVCTGRWEGTGGVHREVGGDGRGGVHREVGGDGRGGVHREVGGEVCTGRWEGRCAQGGGRGEAKGLAQYCTHTHTFLHTSTICISHSRVPLLYIL